MSGERSNDSSTFDALWDFDLGDDEAEDLPPALAPKDGSLTLSQDKRDTLLPPVPTPEYVQTMMELGELDDPSLGGVTPRPTEAAKSLGLVMASEAEFLLGAEPDAPISDSAQRIAPPPIPAPQGKPLAKSAGLRAPPPLNRGAPVLPGVPLPRAPSIPPPALDDDPLAGLDSLDALDAPPAAAVIGLRNGPDSGGPPSPLSPRIAPASTPRRFTPATPPRFTPATRPDTSGRQTGSSGGLRLRRTGPQRPEIDEEVADRVTPVAIEPLLPVIELGEDLVEEQAPSSILDHVREMQNRFAARNYTGALVLAENVLVSDPTHAVARQTAESCREMLAQKYLSSLGGRISIPRVVMAQEEMRWLSLDHRAGFLLSFIDGSMSIEEVLDVSSMPELEALRIMFELRQQGAIEIEERAPRRGRK